MIVGVDNNKLLYYTVVILNDKIHRIYIDFFYGFLEMALYIVPTRLPEVIQKAIFNKIQSESCHEVEIAAWLIPLPNFIQNHQKVMKVIKLHNFSNI